MTQSSSKISCILSKLSSSLIIEFAFKFKFEILMSTRVGHQGIESGNGLIIVCFYMDYASKVHLTVLKNVFTVPSGKPISSYNDPWLNRLPAISKLW